MSPVMKLNLALFERERYCSACGSKIVMDRVVESGYDTYTGKLYQRRVRYVCLALYRFEHSSYFNQLWQACRSIFSVVYFEPTHHTEFTVWEKVEEEK